MSIDTTKGIAGLKGALRYVRAYRDHVFVVKLGGDVLSDRHNLDQVTGQLALLASLSIRLIVVHGGGTQASALSKRLGREPEVVAGRRVTDADALEVVKMVYRGQLNTDLVAALRHHGVQAVGLSGVDGDLLAAHRRPPVRVVDDAGTERMIDYGHVGDIDKADPRVLTTLLDARFVPVVSSLAGDGDGNVYNVNADTVAETLATALKAQKLIFLTGAPGVLRDRDAPEGGGMHPRGHGWGRAHPHHRWSGARRPAHGGVHRCGVWHHDRGPKGKGDLSWRRPGRLKSRFSANWWPFPRSVGTRRRRRSWSRRRRVASASTWSATKPACALPSVTSRPGRRSPWPLTSMWFRPVRDGLAIRSPR
jgi:acetylglutamate kinase